MRKNPRDTQCPGEPKIDPKFITCGAPLKIFGSKMIDRFFHEIRQVGNEKIKQGKCKDTRKTP